MGTKTYLSSTRMIDMGMWSIKSLEKTADYQDFIQNRRPAQQARDEALQAKFAVNEVKTYQHITTPDSRVPTINAVRLREMEANGASA